MVLPRITSPSAGWLTLLRAHHALHLSLTSRAEFLIAGGNNEGNIGRNFLVQARATLGLQFSR
jgi:hypothetical protein